MRCVWQKALPLFLDVKSLLGMMGEVLSGRGLHCADVSVTEESSII